MPSVPSRYNWFFFQGAATCRFLLTAPCRRISGWLTILPHMHPAIVSPCLFISTVAHLPGSVEIHQARGVINQTIHPRLQQGGTYEILRKIAE